MRDSEIYSEGGRMFSVWLINSGDVIRGREGDIWPSINEQHG